MAGGGAKPGERRGGRKAGVPNKLTRTIKDAIEAAFEKVGGVEYLARQAEANPTAFMTLLGKVLPTQIEGDMHVIGMPAITIPIPAPDAD